MTENIDRVKLVLTGIAKLKVFESVVGLVAVNVVDLDSIWNRAVKSLPDQPMSRKGFLFLLSLFVHADAAIPSPVRAWGDNALKSYKLGSTKVRDLIHILVTGSRNPNFHSANPFQCYGANKTHGPVCVNH